MTGIEGRVALVTGGGRGIGLATADLLASRGARIMSVARSQDELAAAGHDFIAADLGALEGCEQVVRETEKRLGSVDILVCNHGIGSAHERVVWEQDPIVWQESMRVNLDAPFYLSRLVLPGMIERRYGRVVYTSSTAGLVAEYAGSAYNSSIGSAGRGAIRRDGQCGVAGLGAHGNGGTIGTLRGKRPWYYGR